MVYKLLLAMTNEWSRARQLEDRMINFALSVIHLTKKATDSTENRIVINQLIRSATSVGANYAEANNAASKTDFRNKIFIAKKEAAETRYWLHLFTEINPTVSIAQELDEVNQLIFILQKIVSTLKNAK